MRQEQIEAGRMVTADLMDLETQLDMTIAASSRLPGTVVEARMKAHLPAAAGQEALLHAAKAFELMVQARKHVVQAHASLAATGRDYGIAPIASGNWHDCPELGAAPDAGPRLSVVQ